MITMEEIKKLREESGAGVMEVKRALEESDGDTERAREILKKRGLERAKKKAERETGAMRVFAYVHFNGKVGALVKLSCETDFVARTEAMAELGKKLAMQVASMGAKSVEELLAQEEITGGGKVEVMIKEVSGKTGENIRVAEIARLV